MWNNKITLQVALLWLSSALVAAAGNIEAPPVSSGPGGAPVPVPGDYSWTQLILFGTDEFGPDEFGTGEFSKTGELSKQDADSLGELMRRVNAQGGNLFLMTGNASADARARRLLVIALNAGTPLQEHGAPLADTLSIVPVNQIGTVPEPSSFWLLGAGVLLLLGTLVRGSITQRMAGVYPQDRRDIVHLPLNSLR